MKNKLTIAFTLLISSICVGQGPFNLGTIHPGDSVVIIYDVQINNPLVPPGTTQISNQGTVSGSNFSNKVTNDPDSPAPDDPTITLLNMFPLPVTFTEFKAYQKLSAIEVTWKVTETGTYKYEVEKSADGRTFVKIGEVMATGGNGLLHYSFLDNNPFTGSNYYRLKIIDVVSPLKYTHIVRVSINTAGSLIELYPNPVQGKMVNMEMKKVHKGIYFFDLYNSTGQKIFSRQIDHSGGSATEVIYLPNGITKGVYHVQLKGERVVLNKTFVID